MSDDFSFPTVRRSVWVFGGVLKDESRRREVAEDARRDVGGRVPKDRTRRHGATGDARRTWARPYPNLAQKDNGASSPQRPPTEARGDPRAQASARPDSLANVLASYTRTASRMPDAVQVHARAKSLAREIHERQYAAGLRTIQASDWAGDIYTLILNECPHLPEEDVVRLFRNRHPSEAEHVLGEALYREYNLTHGARR